MASIHLQDEFEEAGEEENIEREGILGRNSHFMCLITLLL